jgi:SAM-dependent methyltransferase
MRKALFLALTAFLSAWVGAQLVAQGRLRPEQIIQHPKLEVALDDFAAPGLILDIGGGGEGVIGQLKGPQVVAIDRIKRELEEAPGRPLLKIVMDARDLKFLDNAFPAATVFFTFMYIDPADHVRVLSEIYRVLERGGRLLVWDVVFPEKADAGQIAVSYPVHIVLPSGREVVTSYGVKLVRGQGMGHLVDAASRAGFEVVSRAPAPGWFKLELRKPAG